VAEKRQMGSASAASGGIPGALSNQPPVNGAAQATGTAGGETDAAETAKPVNESMQRTRNFELDRTLSHTRQPTGAISRLTVAVLVDDKRVLDDEGEMTSEPLTADELENIDRLVKDAVGYDAARGDSVSVSNIAFFDEPNPEPLEEAGETSGAGMSGLIKQILGAVLVLAIAFGVVRPLLRTLGASFSTPGTAAPRQVAAIAGGSAAAAPAAVGYAAEQAPQAGSLSYEDKMSVARQAADRDPERVAQIVRSWVQSDG